MYIKWWVPQQITLHEQAQTQERLFWVEWKSLGHTCTIPTCSPGLINPLELSPSTLRRTPAACEAFDQCQDDEFVVVKNHSQRQPDGSMLWWCMCQRQSFRQFMVLRKTKSFPILQEGKRCNVNPCRWCCRDAWPPPSLRQLVFQIRLCC